MKPTDPTLPLRVHLVEDDDDLREEMVLHLSRAGLDVLGLADAPAFYKAHALTPCDVAVLDIGLDGEDGLSIAAQLRAAGAVGIVMASANGDVPDRVGALSQGADAYLVKPIHIDELVATVRTLGNRVRAITQPTAGAPPPAARWLLKEGGWVLCDPNGRQIKLTTVERAFVSRLIAADGAVVSREEMGLAIGGDPHDFDPKRLDVIASRLRRKADQAGLALPLYAVRGEGLVFVDQVDPLKPNERN